MSQPVDTSLAIVGLGCLFPDAASVTEYWANIKHGRDAIRPIPVTHWKPDQYFNADPKKPDHTYGQRGGFLKPYPFNPIDFGIAPNDIEATDTSQLLGMVVAHEALKDAGYGPDKSFDRERVGCIMGVTGTLELAIPLGARLGHPIWREALNDAGVPADVAADVVQRIADSYVGWQENSFPGLLGNVVAGRIAQRLNLGGTNSVVDAACASSLSALHLASMELLSGRADMMVTGGVDTFNDIFMYMCFSKTPALSPTGNARPFDRNGDGTVLGEGIGAVILKRLADAERDGDTIYAVIKGIGTSSDGKGQAIYAPSSKGQAKCLRRTYEIAGIEPVQIDLVEAHGTGTKVGDAVELSALTEVYGEKRKGESWVTLGSVKSQIGHTKSAAGAAGLIKAVMAVYHKVLPPTIKMQAPLDIMLDSPFFCSSLARPWIKPNGEKRRAAISAFGFGGSNFHCVVEEYGSQRPAVQGDEETWIWPIAADSLEGLQNSLKNILAHATSPQKLRGLSRHLRQSFSASAKFRLALVTDATIEAVQAMMPKAAEKLTQKAAKWTDGMYFGSGAPQGKLAVLFPGQGAQYVGMLRDMAVSHPAWLETLTLASQTKSSVTDSTQIAERIYPRTYLPEQLGAFEAPLRATEVAQPAIGALSAGAWNALKECGLKPDMFAGHSFGELTALYAAGVFDLESFAYLAQARGDVMASLSGDLGTMMAVSGTRAAIQTVLESAEVDVVIANHNAPKQVVLSGSQAGIAHASRVLTAAGVTFKKLSVGAAFHSPLVAPAAAPFGECVKNVVWNDAQCPVFANTTAQPYPDALADRQDLLTQQLAHGVAFVDQIENMYAAGARAFVEVGPNAKLTGLTKTILQDRPDVSCLAFDSGCGKRNGFVDFARLLAEVAALGHPVNLSLWDNAFVPGRDDLEPSKFAIALSGANYRKPKEKRPQTAPPQKTVPQEPRVKDISMQPKPPTPALPSQPVAAPAAAPAVTPEAWSFLQESFVALQRMQQENAALHRQFLENQAASQAMFHRLMADQQSLMLGHDASRPGVATRPYAAQASASAAPAQAAPTFAAQAAPAQAATTFAAPAQAAPTFAAPAHTAANFVAPVQAAANFSAAKTSPYLAANPVSASVVAATSAKAAFATLTPAAAPSTAAAPILIGIIAEKTGYPESMLEMSMSLEADLGIDSIKRVEIFAALQDAIPEAAALKPDELAQLRTLADIVARIAPPASTKKVGAHAAPTLATDSHLKTLMTIVSEKTGYPIDMLHADMALEADLGIDSIKRVEIFADLQERVPQAARITAEHLGSLATLAAIADYLGADTASAAGAEAATQTTIVTSLASAPHATTSATHASAAHASAAHASAAHASPTHASPTHASPSDAALPALATATTSSSPADIASLVMAVIAEKTGYPVDMLALDMELESDLGIDSIKRVEIFAAFQDRWPSQAGADAAVLGGLRSLREIVTYFGAEPTAQKKTLQRASNPEDTLERFEVVPVALASDATPVQPFTHGDSVWVVVGHEPLGESLAASLIAQHILVQNLTLDQALTAEVPEHLHGLLFLVPEHGSPASQEAYVHGAFQILQKAAASLQRAGKATHSHVASVTYLSGNFGLSGLSQREKAYGAGIAGLLKTVSHEWPDVNAKAIDVAPTLPHAVALLEKEWQSKGPREVGLDAGGQRWGLELKKSPVMTVTAHAPEKNQAWIVSGGARGVTASVAQALADAWQPTLVLLGRSDLPEAEPNWAKGHATKQDLQKALLASGGQWTPKTATEAVSRVLQDREVRDNLQSLRDAGATIIYRSVDIRDAMAVATIVKEIRQEFGPIRGIVHGAGVLSDKWLVEKTLAQFQSVYDTKIRGIEALLDAVDGLELRYLLLFSSSTGRFGRKGQCDYAVANEVLNKLAQYYGQLWPECRVVAVNWGPWDGGMVTPDLKKLFASEGIAVIPVLDGARYVTAELLRGRNSANEVVLLGKAPEAAQKILQTQAISIAAVPVLKDHVMNGHAVVPAALMMEWLSQAALHAHPGLVVTGLADFKVLKGIVLKQNEQINLQAIGGDATFVDRHYEVTVLLCSESANGKTSRHATARIRLADDFDVADHAITLAGQHLYPLSVATAYDTQLFHGPSLHGITSVESMDNQAITASTKSAPLPNVWMRDPLRGRWLADPLAIDCAFQLLILWSQHHKDAPALPCAVGYYEQFRASFPSDGVQIRAKITAQTAQKITATIEFLDNQDALVARIENYEGIVDAGLQHSFQRNDVSANL